MIILVVCKSKIEINQVLTKLITTLQVEGLSCQQLCQSFGSFHLDVVVELP